MARVKTSLYRFLLDFLAEERPIFNEELNKILQDKESYNEFVEALKKSRDGQKKVSFSEGDQNFTIELVKDYEHIF